MLLEHGSDVILALDGQPAGTAYRFQFVNADITPFIVQTNDEGEREALRRVADPTSFIDNDVSASVAASAVAPRASDCDDCSATSGVCS